MSFKTLSYMDVRAAAIRLNASKLLKKTPLLENRHLNQFLGGHRILFKAEMFQKSGAFKSRGALNSVLALLESNSTPAVDHIISYSSGNHAAATAWAASSNGLHSTIFMAEGVSPLKVQATKAYGATVKILPTRQEAEAAAEHMATDDSTLLIPPFDADTVICGNGTAVFEALQELRELKVNVDAVVTPVGGGGLISGSYLATLGTPEEITRPIVLGAEPLAGNDAAQSLREGKIIRLNDSPNTLADGAKTLALSDRTFHYASQTGGITEVTEEQIKYWTQHLTHLLSVTVEPTSAMTMAAVCRYLHETKHEGVKKTIVVVLSGGNIGFSTRQQIWHDTDYLSQLPQLGNSLCHTLEY